MRGAALLALLAALPGAPARAADAPPIRRFLESVKLGDTLAVVRQVYPPTRKWSRTMEPSGGVERIIIQTGQARYLPDAVESMSLDFKRGRLVRLEVVYSREETKKKPLESLVDDLALDYGEPRRADETYFWWDERTVLAASRVPQPDPSGKGTELRVRLAVMDRPYFAPLR
ncbi:MAG: hypothetical protein KGL53_11700 [Elusimicrobia bacterium]|nr:hypothetical protein [Elusimicrobiota bacterium]